MPFAMGWSKDGMKILCKKTFVHLYRMTFYKGMTFLSGQEPHLWELRVEEERGRKELLYQWYLLTWDLMILNIQHVLTYLLKNIPNLLAKIST
jgi:hypothetical protein